MKWLFVGVWAVMMIALYIVIVRLQIGGADSIRERPEERPDQPSAPSSEPASEAPASG